jgi:hypothetical protein
MVKQQSVTTLPRSPNEDRHSRMIRYGLTMGIRVVCIILCMVVDGWWLLVFAIGAVLLPYFAVVVANTSIRRTLPVVRPGAIVPVAPTPTPQEKI